MSRNELVEIQNTSGSTAWFQLSEITHENVYLIFPSAGRFYIGDDDPNVDDPIPLGLGPSFNPMPNLVAFENFNSNLWAQLSHGSQIRVIRGSVKVHANDLVQS